MKRAARPATALLAALLLGCGGDGRNNCEERLARLRREHAREIARLRESLEADREKYEQRAREREGDLIELRERLAALKARVGEPRRAPPPPRRRPHRP